MPQELSLQDILNAPPLQEQPQAAPKQVLTMQDILQAAPLEAPKPAFDPMDVVRKAQAARYPTAADQGGRLGSVAPSPGMLSFYGSEQPETTGQKLMRAYRTTMNTEPRAETGMDANPFGIVSPGGAVTEGMGLARGLFQSPVANTIQSARQALAGGPVRFIVQSLLRGSKNAEREALAFDAAPQLSKDVEFLTAKTPKQVDELLLKRYQTAKTAIDAGEKLVPEGTTLAREPLLNQIKAVKDRFRTIGEATTRQVPTTVQSPSSIYGGLPDTRFKTVTSNTFSEINKNALAEIERLYDEVAKQPADIPFERLRELLQRLDKTIKVSGGWSETGSAADRAVLVAQRGVSGAMRQHLSTANPEELTAANKAYAQAMDLLNAARIDPARAYRIGTLAESTPAQRALSTAAKLAAGGAGLTALEKLVRSYTGSR